MSQTLIVSKSTLYVQIYRVLFYFNMNVWIDNPYNKVATIPSRDNKIKFCRVSQFTSFKQEGIFILPKTANVSYHISMKNTSLISFSLGKFSRVNLSSCHIWHRCDWILLHKSSIVATIQFPFLKSIAIRLLWVQSLSIQTQCLCIENKL